MSEVVRADPAASMARARDIGTAVNVGALGIGPLLAGVLAQWADWPLTLPYLVFVGPGRGPHRACRHQAAARGRERPHAPAARRHLRGPVHAARRREAAADVYTDSTTFVLLESIRLDLGVGSQIHP